MLENVKNFLWSPATILFIVVLAVILAVKTRFRALSHPIKKLKTTLFSKSKNKSSFEAMCTALGGTIGVGNTIGVAGAIAEGGAGALFWMITASFFGMVIKEAEIFLAVKFKPVGNQNSGPMYYIERGIGSIFFAKCWAVLCILTAFGMGNFSQSMSCINSIHKTVGINKAVISLLFSLLVFLILKTGLFGIKKAVSSAVPVISVLFIVLSFVILFIQRHNIPSAMCEIFKSAFNFKSGITGVKWSAFCASIRCGFSRGIFTNEAGLGSACIVHSTSDETSPEKQASWGVVEVFIDTVVICTLTGLMILSLRCNYKNIGIEETTLIVFTDTLGKLGSVFYAVSTFFFAAASILAWYFYSECAIRYIGIKKDFLKIYKFLFALACFFGGIIPAKKILQISDIFNALMLITNLCAVFLLTDETKSN